MPQVHCGRCALDIQIQSAPSRLDSCPRCLARSGTVTPMVFSARGVNPAAGWGGPMLAHQEAPRRHDERLLASVADGD